MEQWYPAVAWTGRTVGHTVRSRYLLKERSVGSSTAIFGKDRAQGGQPGKIGWYRVSLCELSSHVGAKAFFIR